MFVITKEFKGRAFASYEDPDPKRAISMLGEELRNISADPRLTVRVAVRPRPVEPSNTPLLPR